MLSSYSYDSSSLFQSHEEYQDLTFCYTFDQDPINVNPFSFENLCDVKPLSSNNGPFANTDKPIKMDVQKQNIEPETSKNDNSIEKLSFEDLILMNEMHSLNNCLLGDTDNEPEDLPDSLLVDESSNLHKENLDLLKKQVDTLFHLKLKMYELSNQIKNDCDIKSINSIFEKKMNKIDQMEELWIKKWKKISGQKEFKNNELYKSEQLITVIQSKFVKLRKSLQSKILESLNSVNIVEPFKKPLKRKQKTNDSIININKKDFSLKNKCQKPKTAENMTVIKSRGKKRIERSTINQKIKIFRPPSIKRKRLNKGATKYLDDWFQKAMSSVNGPYANHRTKLYLSQQTGFSVRQVTNYLGNQRKKFRKTLDKDQISKFDWLDQL
ncbi:homeobox protein transcription factor [Anaeramoeba flamelloides]|uniref:Homeobox protein transcription factor n=1 Tax=Anaeramoeba flamelloides TaxID=1746091 RepID=A0ABQ8XXN4_9EUKA|nr:homeobox protein transcription factor [Anaeramoeba flamelloides]